LGDFQKTIVPQERRRPPARFVRARLIARSGNCFFESNHEEAEHAR
jgi:hypothetical protein